MADGITSGSSSLRARDCPSAMVGAKRPRRGGKPDKVRKCRNPTPYVTFELLKQPCEKASKLLDFSTCGRGRSSPHVSEKERARRPFQGDLAAERGQLVHMFRAHGNAEKSGNYTTKTASGGGGLGRERDGSTWERWWRKTTCHRNCGNVDEVRCFDARAFWTRETTWHRNSGDADGVANLDTGAF